MGVEVSMRKIVKHFLEFDKTISYFLDHIEYDTILSKKIINKINFTEGSFFTILPENADLNRLYDFKWGGVIPPVYYGDQVYYLKNDSEGFIPQKVQTMDFEFSKYIINFMQINPESCLIIENVMLDSTNSLAKIDEVQEIAYGAELYYILKKNNSTEQAYNTIRRSHFSWHFFSVLTILKNQTDVFNFEDLNFLCNKAKFVISGAYDGEGYIFWEKNQTDSTNEFFVST